MAGKLKAAHKHIMRLIRRDKKSDGWTSVSDVLYPHIVDNLPGELVETKWVPGSGAKAKLTEEGEIVLNTLERWLE